MSLNNAQANLRLLLVGPISPPAGGMSMQTSELKKRLRARGVKVLFLPTNPKLIPNRLNHIRVIRGVLRFLILVFNLLRVLPKVDTIHLMANSGWSWYLNACPVLWLAHLKRKPVVVNYRGGNAKAFFSKHIKRIKPFMNYASLIVVPSSFLHQVFSDFGFSTTIIPNCVDTNKFKPNIKHEGLFHCLMARNLENIYGIDIGIKAFAQALAQCPNMVLTIAGSGPQEGELKSLVVKLNIQQKVNFVGRLNRAQIKKAFKQTHVLLNPSRVDNMPNALLEAQASGVAIITSDVGGIPYMVEHGKTAIMVPNEDVSLMAEGLIELYHNKNLREALQQNSLEHIQQFNWSQGIQQWQQVYYQVSA